MNPKFARSIFIIAIYAIADSIFFPYVNPYLKELGMSDSAISFLYAFSPIFILFIAPAMGTLADIIGKKRILVWTSLVLAISVFGIMFLRISFSFYFAAVFLSFYIVFCSVMEMVALATAEDSSDNGSRGRITGIYQSLRSLFLVVGALIGVYITKSYSVDFAIFVSFLLFVALIIYSINLKKRKVPKNRKKIFNFRKGLGLFFKDRRLRLMGILGILTNFSEGIFNVFVPLFMVFVLKAPLYLVGALTAIRYGVAIFQFHFGKMCDISGSGNMISIGILLKALALMLLPLSTSLPMLLIVIGIVSIGGSIWNTSAWCYMSEIGEDRGDEAEIVGSYISISHLGPLASYVLGGLLVGILGYRGLFFLAALVCLFGAFLAFRKLYDKSVDKASVFS